MGKIKLPVMHSWKVSKREYQIPVENMESYSEVTDSSFGSSISDSESSDSESSSTSEREIRKKKVKKKSSKLKREKRSKRSASEESDEEEESEYEERERKRRKHSRHRNEDSERYVESYCEVRGEERKHRTSRKHKHHHRKRKHKHRHRRHRRSGERERRGGSADRSEEKRGRYGDERRYKDRSEGEKLDKRKMEREAEKRDRKDERKHRERYESRQVKSKWDDEEEPLYDVSRRIKVEPDSEDDSSRGQRSRRSNDDRKRLKIKREEGREAQERVPQVSENDRPEVNRGIGNNQNIKQQEAKPGEEKQKPNLGLSGKLAEDSNTFNGVVIKYTQPAEARKPKRRWRWYIFKGEEDLPYLPLHRQSAYLIGRDRKVADIPTDHPSCSKQHAVLQYRLVTYTRGDGTKSRTVKPYLLDLESANGTYVNNRRIETRRYVELLEKDVVKFGYSSREYILLHEGSKDDDENIPDTGVEMSPVSLLRSTV